MAVNMYPFVKNLRGADKPMTFPGLIQAGSTQEIKRGEICCFNKTSGYWIPCSAAADRKYGLAISNEEQKSDGLARYAEFIRLGPEDVFEFPIDAAAQIVLGDTLTLTSSNSQALTRDVDGLGVCTVVGFENYPLEGSTLEYKSYAQVVFHRNVDYWAQQVVREGLKKIFAITAAYTLTAQDNGAIVTNKDATGSVTVTAPASIVPVGYHVRLVCAAAQALVFDPKPDTASVIIKGGVQAAGKYVSITDEGDFIDLIWDGTDWIADLSISGADGDITVEG